MILKTLFCALLLCLLAACGGSSSGSGQSDVNPALDSDNDGEPDITDDFPQDPSETIDSDQDGVGDNADAYPNDETKSVFYVRGSVTGLNESLQVNLNDQNLLLVNNDSFEFAVAKNASFTITISQLLENQLCDVENASHAAPLTADITDINITCINRTPIADVLANISDDNFKVCLQSDTVIKANVPGYESGAGLYVDQFKDVTCSAASIGSIEGIAGLVDLTSLHLDFNQLQSADLTGLGLLTTFSAHSNFIANADLNENIELTSVDLHGNQLAGLIVNNNENLESLKVYDNPLLTVLEISENLKLEVLDARTTSLTQMTVETNTQLTELHLSDSPIESLNLEFNLKLTRLFLNDCNLPSLDVSNNAQLTRVDAEDNGFTLAPTGLLQLGIGTFIKLTGNDFSDEAKQELEELKLTYTNLEF